MQAFVHHQRGLATDAKGPVYYQGRHTLSASYTEEYLVHLDEMRRATTWVYTLITKAAVHSADLIRTLPVSLNTETLDTHREQFVVQYLAQGHAAQSGDQHTDLLIRGRPPVTPEPQALVLHSNFLLIHFHSSRLTILFVICLPQCSIMQYLSRWQ